MTPQMFADAKAGLTGTIKLLAGQSGYHGYFDVSAAGLARSFVAALPALPLAFLNAAVSNELTSSLVLAEGGEARLMTAPHVIARWALMWAYFPVLAAALTRMVGRRERFAPWVVVHNWTHLLVIVIQTLSFMILAGGLVGLGNFLLTCSIVFMAYAFVRVAGAALEVGPALAIGAGAANLLCVFAVSILTAEMFAG